MPAGPSPAPPPSRPPLRQLGSYSGFMPYTRWAAKFSQRGRAYMTLTVGQWDGLLAGAYDAGFTLIELNDRECVVAIYRKDA